jgi:hypothetical protein
MDRIDEISRMIMEMMVKMILYVLFGVVFVYPVLSALWMAAAWCCGAYSIIMALIGGNPVPNFTVWQCIVLAALAYTAFVWAKSRSLPQRQAERTTSGLINPYVQLSQEGSTAVYFKIQPSSLSYRLQDMSHAQLRGYDLVQGCMPCFSPLARDLLSPALSPDS